METRTLGWFGIFRLGLVQTALGAIVVLTTSTMNRVMVVELALPAMLPGVLVGIHYAIQMLRPRLGHGSDVGGRRTPWIVGGMVTLAAGGTLASLSIALMTTETTAGVLLAMAAFVLIGLGVGASGTSLLVLLAKQVAEPRRPAAATLVWTMMIVGFVITAGIAGSLLDPFSITRLVIVTAGVSAAAIVLTVVAVWGVEIDGIDAQPGAHDSKPKVPFRRALSEVWQEKQARLFTIFVFVSMLAYSAQDLVLEPFAGAIFGMTPGESTRLAGMQHGGVLIGMGLVALAGRRILGIRFGTLQQWMTGGCVASAAALGLLVAAAVVGPTWPLKPSVFALGIANGAFAVAAIGHMMTLANAGRARREGVRMGLWGAAQAVAFGIGGFLGTVIVDVVRWSSGMVALSYGSVFAFQAVLFVFSAVVAVVLSRTGSDERTATRARGTARNSLDAGLEMMAAPAFEKVKA